MTDERFVYLRCVQCRLCFIEPVPIDLGRYYPADYATFPPTEAELVAAAAGEQYKVDLLREEMPTGKILEVGPGSGGFAALATRAGYDVEVIDVDPAICRYVSATLGVPAVCADNVLHALDQVGVFDCIAMWHSIEHVPRPWELIHAATDHLVSGGKMVIATPNPDALQARVLGRFWTHLDAPRHVVLMPFGLLSDMAARAGLVTTRATTIDEGSLGWNRFGWVESLRALARSRRTRAVAWRTGVALSRIAEPLERRGLNGTAYTAIFQKR